MSASMPIPEPQTANPSSAERTYSTDSTVEYTYYTDPEWAGDAVICTQTGLELNFEKLNNICDSGVLPSKICITLHSSPVKQNGDNCIIGRSKFSGNTLILVYCHFLDLQKYNYT